MAQTPAEIIEVEGEALAKALNVTPGVVRVWKHRNRIPRQKWPEIVAAFPHLTLDRLVAAEQAATLTQAKAA